MIDDYLINASGDTPLIDFNAKKGVFVISGTSISKQSDQVFEKLMPWIDKYLLNPQDVTELIINLDFINISTSKHLLELLHKLKTIESDQKMITIEWHYNFAEEDMLELGQDYEMMVRLPFKYVGYEHASHSVC